ncbi:MAG: site-2 protease family protein [Candidatus Aenigmatarchaeota archaeon]|nr:MAG: site-2 protease family protein [Candidatus Aenigmarchaeota archaeon]
MVSIGYYTLSVIAFVAVLAAFMYADRKNITRSHGIVFYKKTKRGREFVDALAKSHPLFWRVMGNAGVAAGIVGMIGAVAFLVDAALTPKAGPGLALVLPFPSAEGASGAGFVGVPFWHFMIGIALFVLVHEGFHAIQARNENVAIKSMGVGLVAIIPWAFVEPNERQVRKKPWLSRMRLYAAGAFGNFLLAGVALLVTNFLFVPAFASGAIGFGGYVDPSQYGASEPFPAQAAGLAPPIIAFDGQRVETTEEFSAALAAKKPGDAVVVQTLSESYTIRLAAHPEYPDRAYLGVAGPKVVQVLKDAYRNDPLKAGSLNFVGDLLYWIFALSLGIGLANLFPIGPLDGGQMLRTLAERFTPRLAGDVMRASTTFMMVLILWMIVPVLLGAIGSLFV